MKLYPSHGTHALIGVACGCFALAACNPPPNPATPKGLYEVRAVYDSAFLAPAAHYRSLGLCAAGVKATVAAPCADPVVVAKLQKADAAAKIALDSAKTFILANPTLDAAAYVSAAENAVSSATQIITLYGIK